MGRKSKADTRKPEILKVAYEAAREFGIAKLTLSKIAARMGVAPSLLSHYFPAKQDIVLGLIDYMMDRYDESLMLDFTSIPDPGDRLAALLDARLWEFTRHVVDDAVWYEAFALSLREETVRHRVTEQYRRDAEAVVIELKSLLPDSSLDNAEAQELAALIITMMEGVSYYAWASSDTMAAGKVAETFKSMVLSYFHEMLRSSGAKIPDEKRTSDRNFRRTK